MSPRHDLSARRPFGRRARFAATLVALSATIVVARGAAAQSADTASTARRGGGGGGSSPYPLVPTPVIDTRRLSPAPSFGGYVAVRQTRRNDSTLFTVSRARLTVMAAPRPYLALRLQGDLSNVGRLARDSSVAASLLTDAFVQIAPPHRAADSSLRWYAPLDPVLLVGQFKLPFSLEYLTSFPILRTVNRSLAVDRLSPRRDVGAMARLGGAGRLSLSGALANGSGANATRNADGRELAVGRLTVRPLASLALSGKWAGEGPDHYWGYDARWLWRGATLEGEMLHRSGRVPGSGEVEAPPIPYDAGGGYVLAAYRVLPWLEPVVKWERLRDWRDGVDFDSERWLTAGATIATADERLRLQADWTSKRIRPIGRRANELVAQLIAVY